jgi:hypothetical protein
MTRVTAAADICGDTSPEDRASRSLGDVMRRSRLLNEVQSQQEYEQMEQLILNLELSIDSVRRANGCFDLQTVQSIRSRAMQTLAKVGRLPRQAGLPPEQAARMASHHRALNALLSEPAPVQRLARSMHVG